MPLIYNNQTGEITEGPIPPGGVKVLALVDGVTHEVFVEAGQQVVVSAGEVLDERLQYDNRNQSKPAIETVSSVASVMEAQKKAVELVTAAFAAEVMEVNQKALDFVTVDAVTQDQAKRATDQTSVVGQVAEKGKRADDTIQAIILPTADEAKKAVEDISNTVTATANDVAKRASDRTSVVGFVTEPNRKAIDDVAAEFDISEAQKKAVEDISNTVTATANESAKRAIESIEAAIVGRTEVNQKSLDIETVEITLNGYANQNVQTTTWTNPANVQGNTTNTSASLTATASGLLGTTNNTATGILSVAFRDVNLGDLTITSVILSVENSGAGAGVAIAQPTANIQYQYSLNNGSTWTTFYTHNTATLAKGIRTVNITAIVGQDQSLLSALQIRATGSVTSGTGVGAAYTASFFRAWMTVLANRTYN